MLTPRNIAFVAAAAGALAGLPISKAQACDNDRFPCPVVSEASPQDPDDAVLAAPAQASKKKPTQAAPQSGKPASANRKDATAQAPARQTPSKPTAQNQAKQTAKPGKPAAREQAEAADAPPVQAVQVASPVPVVPEQPYNAANIRTEIAPAPDRAAANGGSTSGTPTTPAFTTQQVAAAGNVNVAEQNEVTSTAAPASTPAVSSWKAYVLALLLGGALLAAMTVRWLWGPLPAEWDPLENQDRGGLGVNSR